MPSRRGFLRALGASLLAPPLAGAQPRKVHRIGVLEGVSLATRLDNLAAFRRGLADLGYVEGRDVEIEYRSADGRADRLQELAGELVRSSVDVLVTSGTPAALWARHATTTIPIVMASSGEPAAEGVVASLARPGGNVTGLSIVVPPALGRERLRLLKQVAPSASRVGVLWNPGNLYGELLVNETVRGAPAMRVQIESLRFGSMHLRLEEIFEAALLRGRLEALIVVEDQLTLRFRATIVEFAAMSRLPVMYGLSEFVEAGGLIAYGADRADMFRRAAGYVHRILGGAWPGALPIESATKFELVVNARTARALDVTVPRADRVIE